MRDIVATIQPEQDSIVRAGLDQSLCVQGAPGTGKTAVGLHRAAYLLYAFRDQLARSGVLVVGPNDSFLSYIADVLPALGEIDATQATVASLVSKANRVDDPRSSTRCRPRWSRAMPGWPRCCDRAVWGHLRQATERAGRAPRSPPVAGRRPIGRTRWSASCGTAGVRYEAGRAMLPQRLAHQVLLRMEAAGDSPDDRVQNAVARSKPVQAYAEALWPALDPAKLVLAAAHRRRVPGRGAPTAS